MHDWIERLRARKEIHAELHWLLRAIVATVGFIVLLGGIAMIVLPGPATLVIPLGLAILSLEFLWAEKLLEQALLSGLSLSERLKELARERKWLFLLAALSFLLAIFSFWLLVF